MKKNELNEMREEMIEEMIIDTLRGKTDYSNRLFKWVKDDLDLAYQKIIVRTNINELLDLTPEELEEMEINIVDGVMELLTKVGLTVSILNDKEKYEKSHILWDKMKDIYVYVTQTFDPFVHQTEFECIEEYKHTFGFTVDTLKEKIKNII